MKQTYKALQVDQGLSLWITFYKVPIMAPNCGYVDKLCIWACIICCSLNS